MTNHSKRLSFDLKEFYPHIGGLYWYMVIKKLQVNLAEIFGPLELVQKVVNPWDWIPIPDSDHVRCSIVNTKSPGHVLLQYQHDWAPTR